MLFGIIYAANHLGMGLCRVAPLQRTHTLPFGTTACKSDKLTSSFLSEMG